MGQAKISMTVYDAIQVLREKKKDLTRVNKTRSLHGYARSMFLGFIIHFIVTIVLIAITKEKHIVMLFTDLFFMTLFWNRSCRYYFEWIRKVVFQYDSLIKGCENHESEQTTKTDL